MHCSLNSNTKNKQEVKVVCQSSSNVLSIYAVNMKIDTTIFINKYIIGYF